MVNTFFSHVAGVRGGHLLTEDMSRVQELITRHPPFAEYARARGVKAKVGEFTEVRWLSAGRIARDFLKMQDLIMDFIAEYPAVSDRLIDEGIDLGDFFDVLEIVKGFVEAHLEPAMKWLQRESPSKIFALHSMWSGIEPALQQAANEDSVIQGAAKAALVKMAAIQKRTSSEWLDLLASDRANP